MLDLPEPWKNRVRSKSSPVHTGVTPYGEGRINRVTDNRQIVIVDEPVRLTIGPAQIRITDVSRAMRQIG